MKDIKLFYWQGKPNFGDMLNVDICKDVFNVNPINSEPENCEASFIGSLLDNFLYEGVFKSDKNFKDLYNKPPVKIWGSGFITGKNKFTKRKFFLPETYFRKAEIYAVRGYYSKKRLQSILKEDLKNAQIGDPGLLAPMLLDKIPTKKYKLGLIPHHSELELPIWKEMNEYFKNSIIIKVDGESKSIINKIAECDVIISSAMHGLVIADSFNIPNMRIIVSKNLLGRNYKFNDYYSAYGIYNQTYFNVKNKSYKEIDLDKIYENYRIPKDKVITIRENLYKSFPYNETTAQV